MDLPARIGKYELQEFLGGGTLHVLTRWSGAPWRSKF